MRNKSLSTNRMDKSQQNSNTIENPTLNLGDFKALGYLTTKSRPKEHNYLRSSFNQYMNKMAVKKLEIDQDLLKRKSNKAKYLTQMTKIKMQSDIDIQECQRPNYLTIRNLSECRTRIKSEKKRGQSLNNKICSIKLKSLKEKRKERKAKKYTNTNLFEPFK